MEKQEVKSKWDELARQLGAEVSAEAEQLVEGTARPPESEPPAIELPMEVASATRPKRRAAGWDSLANEFGLPTPAPTTEPAGETPSSVIQERVIDDVVVDEEQELPRSRHSERPRREEKPRSKQQPLRDEKPNRAEKPRRDEHARREERPRGRERGPRREKPSHEHSRDRHEPTGRRHSSRHVEPEEEPLEQSAPNEIENRPVEESVAPPAPVPEERASRSAAVSLWHKIFGSPVEQTAKLSDVPSIEEEVFESSTRVDDLPQTRATEFDEQASTPVAEFDEPGVLDEREDDSVIADDADTDRKRRRRRGRRRRGGRDDRPTEKDTGEHRHRRRDAAPSDRDAHERIDELATDDDELNSAIDSEDDVADGDSVDANGESTGATSRSRSALQRSIPSWDEAIGFIVEANMQTRSQRRQSSHSSSRPTSRGNRGRGRPRR